MNRVHGGRRRSARVAALGAAGLVAGLLAGPGSAAQARDVSVFVAYRCAFPSGVHDVRADFTGAFPDAGAVDRPIQPGETTVRLTVPRAALDGALPQGASSLAADATLTAHIAQNGRTVQASWGPLGAAPAPVPESQDLELEHRGPVPSVTVTSPGDVRFAAGDLTLALRPAAAEGGQDELTLPPVDCEVAEGPDALLATVPVPDDGAATPSPAPQPSASNGEPGEGDAGEPQEGIAVAPTPSGAAPGDVCPKELPPGGIDESFVPQPPPGAPVVVSNLAGRHGCAYAVGFANVAKLGGAMIVNDPAKNPQLINVLTTVRTAQRQPSKPGGYYFRIDSFGELRLADAESTFLTFGFQPVTAKVEFTNGPLTISTGSIGSPPNRVNFAVSGFYQSLRVYDVKINGTPLDVGPACRTARPFRVVLHGKFPDYVNVLIGGPMSGTVTIPEFSGCGTGGEDLDQLFSAALSGPGNLVAINQGNVCVPVQPALCPPKIPRLPGQD
ncbi:DUF6801 domain-containing protein [Streptomyces sp. NPDC051907]|uniref:DUF6801 domain-containing protein n=1 Tax=Streptomyces sp. NPDC051907 TaxID=3155284 RepID=UPI0034224411